MSTSTTQGTQDIALSRKALFNASAAPQAYLLTLGGKRERRATALLHAAGFAVHRVPPVIPRAAHARLLPQHFVSQLGATWTNRSFSCMLTQREVYARIGRDESSTGRAFRYVFEDDIALHPSFAPAELAGVLHAAEREALASGAELMYLGACRTYRKHGSWRVHIGRRPLGLSRCAVLCTHAYGVASAAAAGLFERISLALGSRLVPAMDQNLFRYAAQSPPKLTRTPRASVGYVRATRTSLPRWVRTGGAGRLAPRAPRTIRTGYAYQAWAFGTYTTAYCGNPVSK